MSNGNAGLNKQIKIGAILSYVSIIFNVVVALFYTPWMIKQIGDSNYGLYTLALSVVNLLLIDFGLSQATSRYISKYRSENNQEEANRFLGIIYKLYFIIAGILLIAFTVWFFLSDVIYVSLSATELKDFKVVFAIIAAYSAISFPFVALDGILISYEKFIESKLSSLLNKVLTVICTVIVLLLNWGLYALVLAIVVSGVLTNVYKYCVVRKCTPIRAKFKKNKKGDLREVLSFSIWTTISMIAMRLVFNITPTILGVVSNSQAIAVFGIVSTIESYSYLIATAINGMFLTEVTRIYTKDGYLGNNISSLMEKVGKFQFAVNGLVIVGFTVIGQDFIFRWLGENYSSAYFGIVLVLIPAIFSNSLQIANTSLIVLKKVKIQAFVYLVTGILNVALSFPLSKFFGTIGACTAICISYIVRSILLNVVCIRNLKFNMTSFYKNIYLKMSIPILTSIILGYSFNFMISSQDWLSILMKAVVVCIIYFAFLMLFAISSSDRKKILSKIC